ncbi:MAG: UDP-N-acetylmuramate dehydrogenase [Candidatus Pacebacteria bacterium]|nr:UDP-N-acetylmuramate dehydrogenase [Candidatus Paceibacterota bacterium]
MIEIKENVNLAQYTTFNIGGEARYFTAVSGEEELREALEWARAQRMLFCVLAGGSNVLFADDGFDGLVIQLVTPIEHRSKASVLYGNKIVVPAGANLTDAIRVSAEAGLSGWENMCGIPGSVGGGVRGNAGAFGTEVKDVLSKVRAMNIQTGEVRDFNNKECEFAYRTSYFKVNPEWVVLTAVFNLKKDLGVQPLKKCDEIVAEREGRHLQDVQCAGSFFKNPICIEFPEVIKLFETDKGVECRGGKVPAGWLIERCGLKGTKVGGALCSEQQANYIINIGDATQKNVLELRDIIVNKVREKFGIELDEEVTIVR